MQLNLFKRRAGKLSNKIKKLGRIKGIASGVGVYGAYSGYKHYVRGKNNKSSD